MRGAFQTVSEHWALTHEWQSLMLLMKPTTCRNRHPCFLVWSTGRESGTLIPAAPLEHSGGPRGYGNCVAEKGELSGLVGQLV